MGTQNLKPGFFKVSRQFKNLNLHNQKQTNAQCWVRIYDLPMVYWGMINFLNIARGVGMPLKLDPNIQRMGPCARVQVDVDYSLELPEKNISSKE